MAEFWEILETDLNYPIPNFIKNAFTMAGYGHPMAFKAITDEHILNTEKFVRERTLLILQQNLHKSINEENCEVLIDDEELRDYFGDIHVKDTTSFQFEPGDVLLIKELVDHVKTIVDRNGKNTGLGHFAKSKHAKRNVSAKKRQTAHFISDKKNKNNKVLRDENELKLELQQKVMRHFNLYAAGTEHHSVNMEQVIVELQKEKDKIYGDVFCVFCETEKKKKKKTKRVVFNSSQGNGCWVLSNLTAHLEKFHNLNTRGNITEASVTAQISDQNDMNDNTEQTVEKADENGNESVIILTEFPKRKRNIKRDDPEELFKQLSSQITKITAAVLHNNDENEEINFILNKSPRKISIAIIPGDGSCLFGALAHQLWMHKINSKKQIQATKMLRAEVVEHILSNFAFFEYHLKDRVYEIKTSKEITDMSMECKLFVRHVLSKSKTWGGVETLLAVSNLYSTNIIVFNEDGVCTKYKKADENYDRSIAVAYRLNMKEEQIRNHYDSVFEAGADDLFSAVRYVA